MSKVFIYNLCLLLMSLFGVLYGISNGRMDAIKDYRTHGSGHPYRSYWHLCNIISKSCLVLLGIATGINTALGIVYPKYYNTIGVTYLWLVFTLVVVQWVWDYNYNGKGQQWYNKDETFRCRTGIMWLDKWLGFHWSP